MGYDTLMHDQHFLGSPSTLACTKEEPGFTHVDVSLIGHPKSIIKFTHSNRLQYFW